MNVCYCGNYGGGKHTRSARCVLELGADIVNAREVELLRLQIQAMCEMVGADTHEDFGQRAEELGVTEVHMENCREYLKEHETPADCILRNRDDVSIALGELEHCKAELHELRKTMMWLGAGLLVSAVLFLVEHWP